MRPLDYNSFLAAKVVKAPELGLPCDVADLNPWLKPHAKAVTAWGVQGGRRAYFLAYGLHKTSIQLETCHQILTLHRVTTGEVREGLIVAPLGVRQEFFDDAAKLGITIHFIRSADEIVPGGLHLTNYETVRDGKLDPALFLVASLDEADVLRSFGSKTFQEFLPLFSEVKYRFVATATPSPNRYKELIHYAGFLGVMDTGQALTRFFQRNPDKAGDLTLYPHKEEEFWLWVNSWAIFLQKPSELGFSDDGYILPPITVRWHEVESDLSDAIVESNGQMRLMRNAAKGVVETSREKRDSLGARIVKAKEIREASPDDHFILWHDLEDERRALEAAIPAVVSVYGSQDLEDREDAIKAFKRGELTDLAAKPIMLGAGGNLQAHCHRAIFCGIGHKFKDFAQAIHRIQRFGQAHPVEIDIIYSENEREVRRDLEAKWARDQDLRARMSEIIRRYGLNQLAAEEVLTRSIGVRRQEASGEGWTFAHNDCVEEVLSMADDSVDQVVTSIPFSNHFEYTPSYNDFGHTNDDAHFFAQMDHLTPQLLRILKPGRLACVHVKDRVLFGNVTGYGCPTVNPFHAKTLFHFMEHGFVFMGMHVIQTDVVRENNQTYRLGYSEMLKDGSKMGCGSPEYVLLMRKLPTDTGKSYADDRVAKAIDEYSLGRWQVDADAIWRSSGDRLLTPAELLSLPHKAMSKAFNEVFSRQVYDHEAHVEISDALAAKGALPKTYTALNPGSWSDAIWTDVNRLETLNSEQAARNVEKHICPLQFDVVDRLIRRFSNKGDLVFDPFGGLGTVPVRALKLGRRGRGVELNPDSYGDAVRYCTLTEREIAIPSLFDLIEGEAA